MPSRLLICLLVAFCLCDSLVISPVQFIHGTSSVHLQPAFEQDHAKVQISHVAVHPNVRKTLLERFSPIIYLHPDDQYLPADPVTTFRTYWNGTTNRMSIPPSDLAGLPLSYKVDGRLMQRSEEVAHRRPSLHYSEEGNSSDAYNEFRRPDARSGLARVTAPVTAQARLMTQGSHAGKIYVQYWYWHHFNGAQGFSVNSSNSPLGDADGVTRWEWWPLAVHNADWEHTTVTLTPKGPTNKTLADVRGGHFQAEDYDVESVYYTVHSEVEDKKLEFPKEGHHPVVYSHLNSHACYATPGDFWNRDPAFDGFVNSFVRFITFGRIQQIKIIDIGFDPRSAIRWSDYQIYDVSDATEGIAPDWFLWKGHWGDPVDQTARVSPPAYVPMRRSLDLTLWILRRLGKLSKFVKPAKKAPRGPFAHWTWLTLDVLPDNWHAMPKTPPSRYAIAQLIVTLLLILGALWALVSLCIIGLLIVVRASLRRSFPKSFTQGRKMGGKRYTRPHDDNAKNETSSYEMIHN